MKRIGNLYHQVYNIENLYRADAIASRGKAKQASVQAHMKCQDENLHQLYLMLRDKTFKTSAYTTFKIYEPKERIIFRLPYFPDRILHHAIMNVLEPVFAACFTADTYSCIKGKGIHSAVEKLKESLSDVRGTQYCLKMDIVKFYPNIDHAILKQLIRRKIKDDHLLWLLDGIIDSADGLPIGNYLSQYFANFYLTYFDHWIKENCRVKHYFRYADDLVALSGSKQDLHQLLGDIRTYLDVNLNLSVKGNYQIFPVAKRGIDFVGYVFFHTHTLLRKSIKTRFARAVAANKPKPSIAAYAGWAKHCNAIHLLQKLLPHNEKL